MTDKKTNRLSHSAANRYLDCAYSYKLHYLEKLRSPLQSAALCFGSAIDVAIGACLKNEDPIAAFNESWKFQEINGVKTLLPSCTKIVYADSDYDQDLLKDDDIKKLATQYGCSKEDVLGVIEAAYAKKETVGFAHLQEQDKLIINLANWHSLNQKGLLMIKAFQEKVMPNIEEVLSVQEKVTLDNTDGDSILGFVDMVVKYKGYDVPIIFDLKTSSREYEADSVITSSQLSLYVHSLSEKYKTKKAGYIVLHKRIQKNKTKVCSVCGNNGTSSRARTCDKEMGKMRCSGEWKVTLDPEAVVQIIINDIPARLEEIVIENLDSVNQAIKTNIFPRNLSNCVKFGGAVICPFYKLCHEGKDPDLEKME
jgi:PD-(D/E)XK nuclease superfamily